MTAPIVASDGSGCKLVLAEHAVTLDAADVGVVEVARCCDGTLTAQAAELTLWQRILPGTTAWRISMGRRQVVESVNAALKGAFVDLGRGFLRVMDLTKANILLGFTLAAYNLDRLRSYRAKHRLPTDGDDGVAQEPPTKARRAKRRTGTWADLLRIPDTG